MRKMLVVAGIAAAFPLLLLNGCAKFHGSGMPPEGRIDEEAPIKVRNGSIKIESMRAVKWQEDLSSASDKHWTQALESNKGNDFLWAQVRFVNGGSCTVYGRIITIEYGEGKSTTIKRVGKRVKVRPHAQFTLNSAEPTLIESTGGGDYVRRVISGSNSCDLELKEQLGDFMCIASTAKGLDECWGVVQGPRPPRK